MRDRLHVYGERAVRPRTGRRRNSFGHLALDEIDGTRRARVLQRVKEDRCRDVVRHVAGEEELGTGDLAEVHLEHVALDDFDVAGVAITVSQVRHEVSIQLDRNHALRAAHEQVGQCAAAGADLDDYVVRRRPECICDSVEHAAVDEKCWPSRLRGRGKRPSALPSRPRLRSRTTLPRWNNRKTTLTPIGSINCAQ